MTKEGRETHLRLRQLRLQLRHAGQRAAQRGVLSPLRAADPHGRGADLALLPWRVEGREDGVQPRPCCAQPPRRGGLGFGLRLGLGLRLRLVCPAWADDEAAKLRWAG